MQFLHFKTLYLYLMLIAIYFILTIRKDDIIVQSTLKNRNKSLNSNETVIGFIPFCSQHKNVQKLLETHV